MSQFFKIFTSLLFVVCLTACTYTNQDSTEPANRTANHEPVSKTVTEQSPAYIRAAPPSEESLKVQIDGTWQDTDDAKRMFVISGEEYIELYEGRQVAKMKLELYNACHFDKGEIDENGGYIWLQTAIDTSCYEIVDLSASSMILIDIEEGKKVRYEKR